MNILMTKDSLKRNQVLSAEDNRNQNYSKNGKLEEVYQQSVSSN